MSDRKKTETAAAELARVYGETLTEEAATRRLERLEKLENPRRIEAIVGAKRHPTEHIGRVVDGELVVMHSQECIEGGDFFRCLYMRPPTTDLAEWPDEPVTLGVQAAAKGVSRVTWGREAE